MDIFEKETEEKNNKKIFKEAFERNLKIVRLVLPIVFSLIGALLLILGVVLLLTVDKIAGIVLLSIGGLYVLVAIILILVLSNINSDKAYERYQKRVSSGRPIYNTNDMSLRLLMLEKKVSALEEEIESLRKNR